MKTWWYEISVYILQTWLYSIRVFFYEANCEMSLTSIRFAEIIETMPRCLELIALPCERALGLLGLILYAQGGHKWEASSTNYREEPLPCVFVLSSCCVGLTWPVRLCCIWAMKFLSLSLGASSMAWVPELALTWIFCLTRKWCFSFFPHLDILMKYLQPALLMILQVTRFYWHLA